MFLRQHSQYRLSLEAKKYVENKRHVDVQSAPGQKKKKKKKSFLVGLVGSPTNWCRNPGLTNRQFIMSLTPEQRLKQKSFTSYFDVTTEDFTESEEYLKDIADEDVSSTITKLSSLVIKFNDSICKFEKVCESYAGVFSTTTKALDKRHG